jgi:hypothetical protein
MALYKEDRMTNWKNGFYHLSEENKCFTKMLQDADKQLVDCMEQIKVLNSNKEQQPKALEELEGAAKVLGLFKSFYPDVDVKPLVEGAAADCSEEKFAKYLEEAKPVAQKIVEDMELD